MFLRDIVPVSTTAKSLLEFAETYPIVALLAFLGLIHAVEIAVKSCLRFFAEVGRDWYDLKISHVNDKRRYEQATGRPHGSSSNL
jgi:hypothetical protein